jgi:hypothetical protein
MYVSFFFSEEWCLEGAKTKKQKKNGTRQNDKAKRKTPKPLDNKPTEIRRQNQNQKK